MKIKEKSFATVAFVAAVMASGIQGTNIVANKIAFESMDPLIFTSLRHVAIGLVLALLIKNAKRLMSGKPLLHLAINTILTLFLIAAFAIGIDLSTAINASILSLTLPIFIYLFAVIFLREPALKQVIVGGAVAMIGSILIIGLPVILNQTLVFGDIVLLLSYVCLAGVIVHTKYAYRYVSTTEILGVRFLVAGIALSLYMLFFTNESFTQGDAAAWWSLTYSILITGVIATFVYYYSLKYIKAEYAAPIFYIDPLVGVVTAAIVLQDQFTDATIVGAGFIIIGVLISHVHLSKLLHKIHLPSRTQRFRRYIFSHRR